MSSIGEISRSSTTAVCNGLVRTEFGSAYVADLSSLKGKAHFEAIFQTHRKDHVYMEIIQETIRQGFEYYYLVLEDQEGRVRGIQPFFVHNQDLMAGAGHRVQKLMERLRRTMPRLLTMKTMMVGLTAGDGVIGALPDDADWCASALSAALERIASGFGASMLVLKEFSSLLRENLACFLDKGYTRIPSMPYTVLDLNFMDFDEYMQKTLSKSYRKDLRRKFRSAAKTPPLDMQTVTDLTPYVDKVYPLYLQVYERSKLRFEKLTKEYLRRIGAERPDKTRFFIWRQEDRPVAFSVCTVHDCAMWDEYIGMDYGVALDLHLYFLTFRDLINWCCKQGLKRYYSTALGYDPKLHLKCKLAPIDLYVRHTSPWINPVFSRALKFLEPTRNDPILKKFPNAREL